MKKNILLIASMALVGLQLPVSADAEGKDSGFFVEPAITYETGNSSTGYPSPFSNSSGRVDGLGIGARLGLHFSEALFLGIDGRYSMPQFTDSSVNYDAKATSTNWGPVLGVQMPNLGARVWGSYVVGGELNPDQSGSFDVTFKNATGYRVGAGFHIASVSLNIEYQDLKYGKAVLEQLGSYTSGTSFDSVSLGNKSWIASVSFPLAL